MTVSIWKKPSTFVTRQKINFILYVFLEILQRYCKLVISGTLDMSGYAQPKWYYHLEEKLCLYAGKKSTSSPVLLWRYCKDMQTYFGYFRHNWSHLPKVIVSTSRRLQCMQKINFIIYFFLKILHFKESCNLVDWQHFGS